LHAHKKKLELVCDIEDSLEHAFIGDPGRLRQIILNLVNNAIKFTASGEVVVRVRAENRAEDRVQLHFEVADTGIGIPHNKQKLIFDAFMQADTSSTRK